MKKWMLSFAVLLVMAATLPSCKSKPSDADLQKAAAAALSQLSDKGPLPMVSVKDKVATLTGEVKDDAAKASFRSAVASVKGITDVSDETTVALPPPPPAPVEITADDPLSKAVQAAVKDLPTVKAQVKDGVITLTGELSRSRLQPLMVALNALKPKKIENQLTIK